MLNPIKSQSSHLSTEIDEIEKNDEDHKYDKINRQKSFFEDDIQSEDEDLGDGMIASTFFGKSLEVMKFNSKDNEPVERKNFVSFGQINLNME
jgi:hypothetical protein